MSQCEFCGGAGVVVHLTHDQICECPAGQAYRERSREAIRETVDLMACGEVLYEASRQGVGVDLPPWSAVSPESKEVWGRCGVIAERMFRELRGGTSE